MGPIWRNCRPIGCVRILASVWHAVLSDLRQPDLVWQLAALAGCLLLAKLGERLLRGRPLPTAGRWEIGQGWLKSIAFPVLALQRSQGYIRKLCANMTSWV